MYLEFIIGTTARPHHLMTMLGSIKAQTDGNCKCHVIKKGDPDETYDKVISFYKDYVFGDHMRYTQLNKAISDQFEGQFNLYGNFEYGLSVVNKHCDWVIMTNDDNYYSQDTIKRLNKVIEKNPNVNLIYFDMLYNSDMIDSTGEYIGSYEYYKTSLEFGLNDIGCFAYRANLTKDIKFDRTIMEADFLFLKEYIEKNCQNPDQIEKINKALFIHN